MAGANQPKHNGRKAGGKDPKKQKQPGKSAYIKIERNLSFISAPVDFQHKQHTSKRIKNVKNIFSRPNKQLWQSIIHHPAYVSLLSLTVAQAGTAERYSLG